MILGTLDINAALMQYKFLPVINQISLKTFQNTSNANIMGYREQSNKTSSNH